MCYYCSYCPYIYDIVRDFFYCPGWRCQFVSLRIRVISPYLLMQQARYHQLTIEVVNSCMSATISVDLITRAWRASVAPTQREVMSDNWRLSDIGCNDGCTQLKRSIGWQSIKLVDWEHDLMVDCSVWLNHLIVCQSTKLDWPPTPLLGARARAGGPTIHDFQPSTPSRVTRQTYDWRPTILHI